MIPAPGLNVYWPAGSPKQGVRLPPEGAEVTLDSYWSARLSEGSTTVEAAAPIKTAPVAREGK
jgi:hypothetical protein